jgi:ribosomal protein S18 acetylase RimI-like enzyme
VLALLEEVYWLEGVSREKRRQALLSSSAVVIARDERGVAAFARAVSDGRTAWIYDVIVGEAHRKSGIGSALFSFLLDHPAVRDARVVRLGTRDAADFYRRFGFVEVEVARAQRSYRTVEMMRTS